MFNLAKVGAIAAIIALSACSSTTTSDVKKRAKDAPRDIANAPAETLNLKNKKIPEFLADADEPYLDARGKPCADISDEIVRLDEFLGPDWDSDEHYSKNGGKNGNVFNALIPYRGIARFVSGASKHERNVLQASDYGSVRRAYLKTISKDKGC